MRRRLVTQLALRIQLLNLKLQSDVSLFQRLINFDTMITELISAGTKLGEMDKITHLLWKHSMNWITRLNKE